MVVQQIGMYGVTQEESEVNSQRSRAECWQHQQLKDERKEGSPEKRKDTEWWEGS